MTENASQEAGMGVAQKPTPAPAAPKAVPTVTLRHPNTGDVKTVDAVPTQLVPLMVEGYVQYNPPAAPAKE